MLSHDLRNLCESINKYADTGIELSPEGINTICAVLAVAAEDARQLEKGKPPMTLTITYGEPPHQSLAAVQVLDFITIKARRQAEKWLLSQGLKVPAHLINQDNPEGAA